MTDKTIHWQIDCLLKSKSRGFHLIMNDLEPEFKKMPPFSMGLLHVFLQHTSASLILSENSSEAVQTDLEHFFNHLIPEQEGLYRHADEGVDDMPAHIKNAFLGSSLTIPIKNGQLTLGRWQGIYLCEHRLQAPPRQLILHAHGTL